MSMKNYENAKPAFLNEQYLNWSYLDLYARSTVYLLFAEDVHTASIRTGDFTYAGWRGVRDVIISSGLLTFLSLHLGLKIRRPLQLYSFHFR